MEPSTPAVFRRSDALAGIRLAAPIVVSTFAYGTVLGVLARGKGLSGFEALAMSATVFAGAAQFVVLELWEHPLPALLLTLTALVVNVRLLLYGASIAPWFQGVRRRHRLASAFFLTDESWAITAAEMQRGGDRAAILLGSGLATYGAWVGGTLAGHLSGGLVEDPVAWGLDFVFVAVFVTLLVRLRRGRRDAWSWSVAAAVAILADRLLPGAWYIVLGGVAGSAAGALRAED